MQHGEKMPKSFWAQESLIKSFFFFFLRHKLKAFWRFETIEPHSCVMAVSRSYNVPLCGVTTWRHLNFWADSLKKAVNCVGDSQEQDESRRLCSSAERHSFCVPCSGVCGFFSQFYISGFVVNVSGAGRKRSLGSFSVYVLIVHESASTV